MNQKEIVSLLKKKRKWMSTYDIKKLSEERESGLTSKLNILCKYNILKRKYIGFTNNKRRMFKYKLYGG